MSWFYTYLGFRSGKLQALPTDAHPILSSRRYLGKEAFQYSLDDAFFDVAEGICEVAERLLLAMTHRFYTAYQVDDDDEILASYLDCRVNDGVSSTSVQHRQEKIVGTF